MELANKVVVVTGGGSGIGAAIARAAVAEQARHVVVVDLDADAAQRVADEIGGTAAAVDVSDDEAIRKLVADTEDAHGPIGLFVSNAGYVTAAGLEDANESIQKMWEVHCMAHIYAARVVLPSMIAQGEGYILSTASAAGLLTQLGSLAYSITKAAAVSIAEWIAISHHHQGIRASVLCPQAVATNIIQNSPDYDVDASPDDFEGGVASGDGVLDPADVAAPSARAPTVIAGWPECADSSRCCTPTAISRATRSRRSDRGAAAAQTAAVSRLRCSRSRISTTVSTTKN
jgi:NAD(P)-dependent dehydrogenase (short-subunit alcohol dehydrogenase family)